MEKITLTRQELYHLVWSESMLSISKKYKISDTGLRKMCLRLKVPTPYPGYWRQVERGKNPKKTRLVRGREGGQTTITLIRRAETEGIVSEFITLRRQIEKEHHDDLKVPKRLRRMHPLIVEARKRLSQESPQPFGSMHVQVSPINNTYALRLLNSILLLFTKRGHQVQDSSIVINGTRWSFSLEEAFEKDNDGTIRRYKPTSVFTFKVKGSVPLVWRDSRKERIENKLSKIVARTELAAKEQIETQLLNKKFQDEQRARERVELESKQRIETYFAELNRLKAKELSSFKSLVDSAELWHKTTIIRNYINVVTRRAMSKGTLSEELIDWIVWAKKKCNWYDPLVNAADELMEGVDRMTLAREEKYHSY